MSQWRKKTLTVSRMMEPRLAQAIAVEIHDHKQTDLGAVIMTGARSFLNMDDALTFIKETLNATDA